jgi:hypothetical protein
MPKILLLVLASLFSSTAFAANCAALSDPIEVLRCAYAQENQQSYDEPYRLECGKTVDCYDRADVINRMREAWTELRGASGVAKAYADPCFDALKTMQSLSPQIKVEPGIVTNQLMACNAGLAELGLVCKGGCGTIAKPAAEQQPALSPQEAKLQALQQKYAEAPSCDELFNKMRGAQQAAARGLARMGQWDPTSPCKFCSGRPGAGCEVLIPKKMLK